MHRAVGRGRLTPLLLVACLAVGGGAGEALLHEALLERVGLGVGEAPEVQDLERLSGVLGVVGHDRVEG